MESKIFVSGIGRKIKTDKAVQRYLANKAGVEEKELTVVRFRPRNGNEKGICVLKAKREVADKIKRIHFHNWKVVLFPMKLPMHAQLSESEQSPIGVTITYPYAKSGPSIDLLHTKLEDKFKKYKKKVNYPIVLGLQMKYSGQMSSQQLIVKLEKRENNPGPNVDDFNDIIFAIRSTFQELFGEKFSVHYVMDFQIPQIGGSEGDIPSTKKYPFFPH